MATTINTAFMRDVGVLNLRKTVVTLPQRARERLFELIAQLRGQRPELTATEAFRLVVASEEGAELYRQMRTTDPQERTAGVEVDTSKKEGQATMKIDKRPLRERAWEVIVRLAKVEQHKDATLTREQAIARVIDTADGRAAATIYESPAGGLSAAEATTVERRKAAGLNDWSRAVDVCVQAIMSRDGVGYDVALRRVPERYPAVWNAYRSERS